MMLVERTYYLQRGEFVGRNGVSQTFFGPNDGLRPDIAQSPKRQKRKLGSGICYRSSPVACPWQRSMSQW
jgi:hypothetical protein